MSLSILWLFAILIFVLAALFESRNRLFVYSGALSLALLSLGIVYIVDKYALGLRLASLLSSLFHNMFKGIFSAHDLSNRDLSVVIWATALLVIFVVFYIFWHILIKYMFIGRNPLRPYRRRDVVSHIGISVLFAACGFVISTFVFTFIMPLSNLEAGFMKPFFDYLYGGLKI